MTDKPRGFAAMKIKDPERFKELVSKGGKASPMNFRNNRELARTAGRKGGAAKGKQHEIQS